MFCTNAPSVQVLILWKYFVVPDVSRAFWGLSECCKRHQRPAIAACWKLPGIGFNWNISTLYLFLEQIRLQRLSQAQSRNRIFIVVIRRDTEYPFLQKLYNPLPGLEGGRNAMNSTIIATRIRSWSTGGIIQLVFCFDHRWARIMISQLPTHESSA